MALALDEIPTVVINLKFPEAAKSYIFIVAELTDGESKKTVLRTGYEWDLGQNALRKLQKELQSTGIEATCLGGGRIRVIATQTHQN